MWGISFRLCLFHPHFVPMTWRDYCCLIRWPNPPSSGTTQDRVRKIRSEFQKASLLNFLCLLESSGRCFCGNCGARTNTTCLSPHCRQLSSAFTCCDLETIAERAPSPCTGGAGCSEVSESRTQSCSMGKQPVTSGDVYETYTFHNHLLQIICKCDQDLYIKITSAHCIHTA